MNNDLDKVHHIYISRQHQLEKAVTVGLLREVYY